MTRIRQRIGDPRVCRLIVAFLKAGVMSEEQFSRTDFSTPQGGILSPLLANIALSAIEERYERHVWPRRTPTIRTETAKILKRASAARNKDRKHGRPVCFPIRYADDFIILVSMPPGPDQDERAQSVAIQEKAALTEFLRKQLGLELSESKTLVTPVTNAMPFLGHHVRVRRHPRHQRWVSTSMIPKVRSQSLRQRIKNQFGRNTVRSTLGVRLQRFNPMLRGWSYFYRHAWGAKYVFSSIDHYVWWTILRWLKKKHPEARMKELCARYGQRKPGRRSLQWRDGSVVPFEAASVRVQQFKLGWLKGPSKWARIEALLRNRACVEDYVHARVRWREGAPVAFPTDTYWLRRFAYVPVAET
jgi:hypothetical protein